jgi:hypothetical protein
MRARRHLVTVATAAFAGLLAPVSFAADAESPPPSIVVKVTDSGFHWGDAAVGAAAAIATAVLVLGLVLAIRQTGGRES